VAATAYSQQFREKATLKPTATIEPTPTLTPISTSNGSLPSDPDAIGGFEYFGCFGCFYIAAPIEGQVCSANNVSLTILGEVLANAGTLTLAYSLDGQKQVPIDFQLQPVLSHWDPFHSLINCTVTLPQLNSGLHSLTVIGTWQFNSLHIATANVTFTAV